MLDSAPVPEEMFGFVNSSQASWKTSPEPLNTQVQLRSAFMWGLSERYVITAKMGRQLGCNWIGRCVAKDLSRCERAQI